MKTLTVKLPDSLDRALRTAARKQGASKSAIARQALEAYLNGEHPSPKGSSFAELTRGLMGCLEGPGDLSCNEKHMEGYGR